MSVSVHIPARFRLHPQALVSRQHCIEEAFGQVLNRALLHSKQLVLHRRGGYVGVRLNVPEFQWSGSGLPEVPEHTRRRLEAIITAKVRQVAEEVKLFEYAQQARKAPPLLPAEISEPFDAERSWGRVGVYEIPSYDRHGRRAQVRARSRTTHADDEVRYAWRPVVPRTGRQVDALVRQAATEWGVPPPDAAFFGIVLKISGGYDLIFWPREGGTRHSFNISNPTIYELRGRGAHARWRARTNIPGPCIVILTRLGSAATDEQRRQILREVHGPEIRRELEASIPAAARSQTQQAVQALDDAVEAEVRRRASLMPAGTATLVQVSFGGILALLPLPSGPNFEWEGYVYLLPVTERARPRGRAAPEQPGEGAGAQQPTAAEGAGERRRVAVEGTGEQRAGAGPGTERAADARGAEAERTGGFIETGEAPEEGEVGALLPSTGEPAEPPECNAFQDEPSLQQLGADGDRLRRLMQEISYALQLPVCDYAARFCLNAAATLNGRAGSVSQYAATDQGTFAQEIRREGNGNLGSVQFIPLASPALQLLRHLAGVTPLISALSHAIENIYTERGHPERFGGRDPISWALHFYERLTPAMEQAVAVIFMSTCRVLMLQLLSSSGQQIQARLANLDQYARLFERVLVPRIMGLDELMRLRDRLKRAQDMESAGQFVFPAILPIPAPIQNATTWREAQRGLLDALATASTSVAERQAPGYGDLVREPGGRLGIRGARGRIWHMEALEQAITMMRGMLEGVDPLIKQMVDVEEVIQRFRETSDIRGTLAQILIQMAISNADITREVRSSFVYAFRASRINESLPSATVPGTAYDLQGIHLMAHQTVGEFFLGDRYYTLGLDYLFGSEQGRAGLLSFLEFTGIILLCVICAPLGVAAGVVAAGIHYEEAREAERVYQALIDPELVITRAEVETQLFAAELGLALSFLPVVGKLGKGAIAGARVLAAYGLEESAEVAAASIRAELRGGARAIARRAFSSLTEEVAAALERGVVEAFVIELAKAETINELLSRAVQPVLERIAHDVSVMGPAGGPAAVRRVLQQVAAQRARALRQ